MARSTFRSQNVQDTPCSDHFWKLRFRKSARRCGAKHISKSKCTKHTRGRTTFGGSDVEKVHAVVVRNTRGLDHFWRFRCRFACQAQGTKHLVKSEQNVKVLYLFQLQPPLHHTALQYIALHYNYNYNYTFTTFYYTTLHYAPLHSITLNYATLHYTTLH